MKLRKDLALARVADAGNAAQFACFDSAGSPTTSRVFDTPYDVAMSQAEMAERLLRLSSESSVNVRSFHPDDHQSKPFAYGLKSVDDILAVAAARRAEGLWTIFNETIDIHDGGVSGVCEGGRMEVTPDDSPRGVEKGGCASWTDQRMKTLLSAVYDIPRAGEGSIPLAKDGERLEFSVHPIPRGFKKTKVLLWEAAPSSLERRLASQKHGPWPNRLSRMLGDKVYGLLVLHALGLHVPETIVYARRLEKPFAFGGDVSKIVPLDIARKHYWIRTSPREQALDAGKSTTIPPDHPDRHAMSPLAVLEAQEPALRKGKCPDTGQEILMADFPSVMLQESVPAVFSGKSMRDLNGETIAEGVFGYGDDYMAGKSAGEKADEKLRGRLNDAHTMLADLLGSEMEIEWAVDNTGRINILQMQPGVARGYDDVIVPGEPKRWIGIDAGADLESFRSLVSNLEADAGVAVEGRIGLTSHKADLLRRAGKPARMSARREEKPEPEPAMSSFRMI
ncbi:MAG: hypothetical protein ING19_12225 [Azospirillum sp.]|nr:hypothetical protein [Azospirillum sp.]